MDEQQQADQQYAEYLEHEQAEREYWEKVGREEAKRLEYHIREEWQKMRDQQLEMMPEDQALDAYFEDQRRRRDAQYGLDDWPGL